MTIITLDPASPLRKLLGETTFTLSLIEAHPLTGSLAPPFVAFQSDWTAIHEKEILLAGHVIQAAARIHLCNVVVGALVDAIAYSLLTLTEGNRRHLLYVHFFGPRRPGQVKRLPLAKKIGKLRDWIPSLKTSPHAVLKEHGAALQTHVAEADKSLADFAAAQQAVKDFHEVGERKALFDKANALRKATYGTLGQIAHSPAGAKLPTDFADQFFRHGGRTRRKPPTLKGLQERLAAIKTEAAAIEEQIAELLAAQQKKAEEEAEAKKKQEAIAAAEKVAAEAEAKLAALRAELSGE